jgi:hypothetical protein
MIPHAGRAQLEAWGRGLDGTVVLRIIHTGDEREALFSDFARRLGALVPLVQVDAVHDETAELPGFALRSNLVFHAAPEGNLLAPFLEMLAGGHNGPPVSGTPFSPELSRLTLPVSVRLFIAPGCPFCPQALRRLLPLAEASRHVSLAVVDGALFPEKAEAEAIRSAPTTIVDRRFRWTGVPPLSEVVDMIAARDPRQLGAGALREMIERGDAAGLAAMMVEEGAVFPALVDLLSHEKWPVRLGAMATFEYLAAADSRLAGELVDRLWDRFDHVDDTVKGDILHTLGESRSPGAAPKLTSVIRGAFNDELKTIARESLDNLKGLNAG